MKEKTAQIHAELVELSRRQRSVLKRTLEHLAELNRRKGFLEFGHPSLLKYCVKELGMSESAAYRRVKALRIVSTTPAVKAKLESGELNLAQISKAQELFESYTQESGKKLPGYMKERLLEKVQRKDLHQSENEIRAELSLPKKKRSIQIEVSEETYQAWIEFKGAMAHKNMSEEMLLRFAIEKAGRIESPKRAHKPRCHNPDSRYIPAHIKREVFKKSDFKCSWPGCDSVYALEVDHIKPVSKGGKTLADNLRLLCRNHNQARNYD